MHFSQNLQLTVTMTISESTGN